MFEIAMGQDAAAVQAGEHPGRRETIGLKQDLQEQAERRQSSKDTGRSHGPRRPVGYVPKPTTHPPRREFGSSRQVVQPDKTQVGHLEMWPMRQTAHAVKIAE